MSHAEPILTIRLTRRWRPAPLLAGALTVITVMSLGGCGGGGTEKEAVVDKRPMGYGSTGSFPVPSEIEPNVNFWRNVYGTWGRDKVAFHDDEHMGVIYEVAQLPGLISPGGYTSEQRAFVAARQDYYQEMVRDMERRLASSQPLSPPQQVLLTKFEQDGGARGVYGAAERVRAQRGLRDRFRRGVEISGRYDRAFREVMRAHGLPEDLAYLPHVESSFQANAVSSAGATGVWQFMPATGRIFMHVNGAVDDRMDPIISAQGAAGYLSQAYNRLGSWPLAITSYNHGQGGMSNAKGQFGQDFGKIVKNYQGKAFGFASRNYYAEFLAAREVAGHPQRYFPEGLRYESPWPHERLVLASSMPADQVASHYGVSTGSLASLNMHWREAAVSGRAALPAGSTVWLPAGSQQRAGSQPSRYSPAIVSRGALEPTTPLTEAAASMAFKATGAAPAFADLPVRTPAAPPPQAKVARVEPRSQSGSGFDELPGGSPVARATPNAASNFADMPGNAPAARVAPPAPKVARVEPRFDPLTEPRFEPTPEPKVARASPPEPKIARVEPPVEPRFDPAEEPRVEPRPGPKAVKATKAQPRIAVVEEEEEEDEQPQPRAGHVKAEPKAAKGETKTAKAESKAAKTEAKTAKADPKAAKGDHKTAKADAQAGKAEAKTAKADPKAAKGDAKTAKADAKAAKGDAKTAKADPKAGKSEPKTAKAGKGEAVAGNTKVHVVKAQETLYRVASTNGISVAELRRLNKMAPNDNNVRPGQKLKVGT
ncbi:transglycosylase SLT domain-containing protein [uncultured Thiodictyon sp.]|uniref:LysM peptidoglycan-binding domain-containing protein n=1 Tax=uncultured Thiodictyon sp. TaxID=1846217 RepID=UPI0025E88058|nr:transglycosylase SLT domain-containing protein [uncultured Thiodictyon sp.]